MKFIYTNELHVFLVLTNSKYIRSMGLCVGRGRFRGSYIHGVRQQLTNTYQLDADKITAVYQRRWWTSMNGIIQIGSWSGVKDVLIRGSRAVMSPTTTTTEPWATAGGQSKCGCRCRLAVAVGAASLAQGIIEEGSDRCAKLAARGECRMHFLFICREWVLL